MKRLLAIGVVVALAPFGAWRPSAAAPSVEDDCSSTTSTTRVPGDELCAPTTTTTAPTTVPVTTAPTTTTTTVPVELPAPTGPPAPATTPSTSAPTSPATTTTTTTPPTETTVASTTTTHTPAQPTTAQTSPTPPPRPLGDPQTDPIDPPDEAPGGRVVVPSGTVDSGELRAVTFPVAGPVRYGNDFGACRDGCRRAHKGNDIIGDRLQPILAMHDGVIDHLVDHPTAGYGVVIRDSDGYEYHVYHMNNDTPGTDDGADGGAWRFAGGIVPGATVKAGQFIGWMGDSGNSEGSVPHAHVEIHRPDGEAINPYWSLRVAQRDGNCAAATPEPATADSAPSTPTGESDTARAGSSSPAGAGRSTGAKPFIGEQFLATGWREVELPGSWTPLTLAGGRPGSGSLGARMWVGPAGYTPVDAAALQVGDARYADAGDCNAAAVDPRFSPIPTELGAILATIRTLESGGDYTAASRTSSASGAYQFVDSTWSGYGGYPRAKDAPPAVQDAAAAISPTGSSPPTSETSRRSRSRGTSATSRSAPSGTPCRRPPATR